MKKPKIQIEEEKRGVGNRSSVQCKTVTLPGVMGERHSVTSSVT